MLKLEIYSLSVSLSCAFYVSSFSLYFVILFPLLLFLSPEYNIGGAVEGIEKVL